MHLTKMVDASTIKGGAIPEGSQPKGSTEGSQKEKERIPAPESHTPTVSPPSVGDARADYPLITFADCLTYLEQQGVAPRGDDAVQIMAQARTLYAHKHPRYEYRARPGPSSHPDDQLPSKTEAFIEKLREWRIEDEQPEEDITQAETVKVPVAPKKPAPHDVLAVRLADGTEALAQVERYEGKDAVRVIWLEPQGQYVQAWSDVFGQKHTPFESSLPVSVDQNYTNHGIAAFGEYRILSVDEVAGLSIIPLYRRLDRQSQQNTPTPTPTPAQASPPQSEQAALEQTAQQNHSAVTPCSAVVTPDVPPSGVPPTKGKAKKQAEPKTETPKSPPVEPASDMAWGTRKCLLWFDYWRGGILIGKFKLMQASTCAKGLAEQLSEEQVIETRTMMEADPYYIGKGGCDVCDVANNIHKYLRRRKTGTKPAASTPDAVNSDLPPDYDVADEFNRYWGINEKRIVIETRGVSYAAV